MPTYTNVTIPVAPPTRYAPGANGDPMPAGMRRAIVRIDTSQMTAQQSFLYAIEYDYGSGFVGGGSGGTVVGGTHTTKSGATVTYDEVSPSIPQSPYPQRYRVAVTQNAQQVTTPAITVTFS